MTKEVLECISSDCGKCVKFFLEDLRIVPFDDKSDSIRHLLSYFLYNAPNIESVHSKNIKPELHDDIFEKMMDGRHFRYKRFCSSNANISNELQKGNLLDTSICLKCKRFVCKKKRSEKGNRPESDLVCFLRHIRNSIAHGRIYFQHGGNKIHIIFEDENVSGNLSARIICIKADLEHWKKVLSDSRYY